MQNQFVKFLDIDTTDAINSALNLDLISTETKILRFQPHEILTSRFLKLLASNNIPVITCLVFYKPPYYKEKIAHIDLKLSTIIQTHALNLIVSGHDSEMIWFEKPSSINLSNVNFTDSTTPLWTNVKTPYIAYNRSELTEIFRYTIPLNKLTMVNVALPHSIDTGHSGRLCISLRTGLMFDNWIDAYQRF